MSTGHVLAGGWAFCAFFEVLGPICAIADGWRLSGQVLVAGGLFKSAGHCGGEKTVNLQ